MYVPSSISPLPPLLLPFSSPSPSYSLSVSLASNSFTKQEEPFRVNALEDKSSFGAREKRGPWRREGSACLGLNIRSFQYSCGAGGNQKGRKKESGRAGTGSSHIHFCVTGSTVPAEQHQGLQLESLGSLRG